MLVGPPWQPLESIGLAELTLNPRITDKATDGIVRRETLRSLQRFPPRGSVLFRASAAPGKNRGKIPPFVKDAHDLNLSTLKPVEDRVRGDKRRPQSCPSYSRSRRAISRYRFANLLDLTQEIVCYFGRGDTCVVPPNADQVPFRRGAHTTLLARAMLDAGLRYRLIDIERLAQSGIEFAEPGFDFCAQPA